MSSARDTVATNMPLAAPDQTNSDPAPFLTMQVIVKRFGATVALDGVDFAVKRGEIHALLGENGAGKSTLMHVLSGLTRPDAGVIRLEGREVRLTSPRQARAHSIAMVHQHFTLVPAFTVAENLTLDRPAVDPLERARSLGWNLDPNARVSDLPVGAQQRIEIVKALATDASLLIFDEPTAVLSPAEVEELFGVLRRLRDEGRTLILIAHKLAEILAVSDRVTILRHGHNVATCRTADTNAGELATWMIGEGKGKRAEGKVSTTVETEEPPQEIPAVSLRDTETFSPSSQNFPQDLSTVCPRVVEITSPGNPRGLEATDLTIRGDRGETAVRGLALEVRCGEIFGIGGVDGNGQTELAEALAGLRKIVSGALTWNGGAFQPGVSPRLGYIPQDRRRAGLAVTMTIEENLLLDAVREPAYRFGPFLRRKALHQLASALIRQFDVRTKDAALPASALSGGNQQKIVVARALRAEPEFLVAVNPTRGLDIGATRFVHDQLRQAQARGAAVVLISTDLDELAALATRTAILSAGQLTAYHKEGTSAADIGLLLGGITHPA
jgi:general nucleoside transport system ATP-binding protein